MLPSGKNIGGYRGEGIVIKEILDDIERVALAHRWTRDALPLSLGEPPQPAEFIAWRRESATPRRRLYISTGMHGDEPAGPLAVRQLMQENAWPDDISLWLCPCLNPTGFPFNRRENFAGVDLNRDYRRPHSAEIRAHIDWLGRQPDFDFTLCLHEDWESRGFYLYELNPENLPSPAEKIIDSVAAVCPIDTAPIIEAWPAQNGVIRPQFHPADRPQWPEAVYLVAQHKSRRSCTLEAPSDFPLATRVAALVTGVRTVLQWL